MYSKEGSLIHALIALVNSCFLKGCFTQTQAKHAYFSKPFVLVDRPFIMNLMVFCYGQYLIVLHYKYSQ